MTIKEEKQRYVLYNEENNEIGEMTWSNAGDKMIIIDHTYVAIEFRGQGLGEQLVFAGVEKARKERKRIIPLCPFAKKEFDENPEYNDVLRS